MTCRKCGKFLDKMALHYNTNGFCTRCFDELSEHVCFDCGEEYGICDCGWFDDGAGDLVNDLNLDK